MIMRKKRVLGLLILSVFMASCYPEENLNVPVNDVEIEIETAIDQYIETSFRQEYGMAIRYKFVDRYVDPTVRVTPPKIETVRPMLDFIRDYWIAPYLEVENGEEFFRNHVPPEIILLGGLIFQSDGTVVLGTADAGSRITFTNVNAVDVFNEEWRTIQLNTVYHEFAHTVHQLYKLPNAFETISPSGYTSIGSWFILSDNEALERGFVSPYGTVNPNEDFAECVAFFLFEPDFNEKYITLESCATADCAAANDGREMIQTKINAISDHYERVTGVSLEDLRVAIQSKL